MVAFEPPFPITVQMGQKTATIRVKLYLLVSSPVAGAKLNKAMAEPDEKNKIGLDKENTYTGQKLG